jgi:hypothetical protein
MTDIHTITECDRRTLQECSSPSPGRNDGTSNETRLDGTASSREHFRCLQFIVVAFENPCREDLPSSAYCPCIARAELTMPRANKKPIPSTMPYPQACPKGEAEGPVGAGPPAMIITEVQVSRASSLCFLRWMLTQIDGFVRYLYCSNPVPHAAQMPCTCSVLSS